MYLLGNVYFHIARRLYRVRVEQHGALPAQRADLRDGLDRTDLVVGVHNGDEGGILTDRRRDVLRPHKAEGIWIQPGYREAFQLQLSAGIQHGVMLKGSCNNVIFTLFPQAFGHSLNGPIVGFAAAGGEEYLRWQRADTGSHLLPGKPDGFCRVPAFSVEAGWVAIIVLQIGQHRGQHFFGYRGGCRVVRVNISPRRFPRRPAVSP